MVQYILAITIAAFSIVSMIIGGFAPETLLLLAFTAVGLVGLFPAIVRQNRNMLIAIFQALAAGLIIFGWFMVLDGALDSDSKLALVVTFITVGSFGLLTISIPLSMPYPNVQQSLQQNASQEGSLFVPHEQDLKANPHTLFSQVDSILRKDQVAGINDSMLTDDDPTTHFTSDELKQIQTYTQKVSATDEDPTTLFSKDEQEQLQQYADRLYGDKAKK